MKRAAAIAAALSILALTRCGGDGDTPSPTPAPTEASTPAESPTPSPPPATADPPARDLLDLARRYRGYPYDAPAAARTTPYNHEVGDHAEFTLIDLESTRSYTVTATVRAVSDHAYFFVEDDASYNQPALERIAADFESSVWPTITGAFGEPATPGVDADPRITILHANLRGAGGYVSAADGYPRTAVPRSAEREILYADQSVLSAPGATYNSLVAHELQHLVHEAQDTNEESWVNEGMSQVAWQMEEGGSDGVWEFLGNPDTQLDFWPYMEGVSVHYAASELFCSYLLDQYGGRENGHVLAGQKADGIEGVESYLAAFGKTFDEVFADFVAANALDRPSGPYAHPKFDGTTTAIEDIAAGDGGDETVAQYGTDYYRAGAAGRFAFDGSQEVTIGIPTREEAFWWSGRGDGINPRLTREIDLSDVQSATLTFDTWHDIEPGWDYAYVSASDDGGRTWTALAGQQTTEDDPVGAAYGPGYTGKSGGWATEQVDLSAYADKKVLLRFEYVTDDATHLTGYAIDNIAIPEIGLVDTADRANGWTSEGFSRISGPMKQEFAVQVISTGGTVTRADLGAGNSVTLDLGPGDVVAVSGLARGTTERATYTWSLR